MTLNLSRSRAALTPCQPGLETKWMLGNTGNTNPSSATKSATRTGARSDKRREATTSAIGKHIATTTIVCASCIVGYVGADGQSKGAQGNTNDAAAYKTAAPSPTAIADLTNDVPMSCPLTPELSRPATREPDADED